MRSSTFARVGFALSLMVIAFVYGFATRWHGWFPNDFLEQASQQATRLRKVWSPGPAAPAPHVYDRAGVRVPRPDSVQPGITLLVSSWEDEDGWKPELRLIDHQGRVLHRWRVDRKDLFSGSSTSRGGLPSGRILHGSHLFPNGDVVVNLAYIGTARLDACGNVLWRLPQRSHHSIERAEDGSFWISGTSLEPRARSDRYPNGFPGIDEPTWLDQILHVSADGTLLDKIGVLDLLYANDLERYIVQEYQPEAGTGDLRSKDLTHMNDVEPLSSSMADEYPLFEAGDLLVSLRDIHLVFVVDPQSKTIKWHVSAPFIQQHDPDFIGDGWIGVFDNRDDFVKRGKMLGGGRIVALQPHTDSTRVLFPTRHSAPFYTDVRGKWQQLENGNMLLTEAMAGRVVEVAPDGRAVWEWVKAPYTESKVPAVLEGTRYDLSPDEIRPWSCSPAPPFQDSSRSTGGHQAS